MATEYQHCVEGQCHCGDLRFVLHTNLDPDGWQLRACQCQFCRAHQTKCFSDPRGRAEIILANDEAATRYRFDLQTTDFLICRRCGVYIGAVMPLDGVEYATLNMRLAGMADRDAEPVFYDGQTVEERVEQRRGRFTPVTISTLSSGA